MEDVKSSTMPCFNSNKRGYPLCTGKTEPCGEVSLVCKVCSSYEDMKEDSEL